MRGGQRLRREPCTQVWRKGDLSAVGSAVIRTAALPLAHVHGRLQREAAGERAPFHYPSDLVIYHVTARSRTAATHVYVCRGWACTRLRAHACVEGRLPLLLPSLHLQVFVQQRRHVTSTPNRNKENSRLKTGKAICSFFFNINYKSDFWQDNTMKVTIRVHAVHEPLWQVMLKGFNYKGVFT